MAANRTKRTGKTQTPAPAPGGATLDDHGQQIEPGDVVIIDGPIVAYVVDAKGDGLLLRKICDADWKIVENSRVFGWSASDATIVAKAAKLPPKCGDSAERPERVRVETTPAAVWSRAADHAGDPVPVFNPSTMQIGEVVRSNRSTITVIPRIDVQRGEAIGEPVEVEWDAQAVKRLPYAEINPALWEMNRGEQQPAPDAQGMRDALAKWQRARLATQTGLSMIADVLHCDGLDWVERRSAALLSFALQRFDDAMDCMDQDFVARVAGGLADQAIAAQQSAA